MTDSLLNLLGARAGERWVTALALPGLLFTGLAVVAAVLGQRDWDDVGGLARGLAANPLDELAATPSGVALAIALVLLAALAAGVLAHLLSVLVLAGWEGRWPLPGAVRLATERRRRRWNALQARFEQALAAGAAPPTAERLGRRRNAIALAEPQRPTWLGDQLAAVATRVHAEYGVDLGAAWPRLWLLLAADARHEVRTARAELDSSAVLAGWGLLYLALGILWWPAALAGIVALLVAWAGARRTAARLAELVESTVDLHLADLARALGEATDRAVTPETGRRITARLRKGA
ncbi:hypothetical protein [Catellatospora bangladeshensis]|uniref:Vegetative cell wall protein gp1 n=1 Tax=Catellatospora bangladeshensis TaxID=310355 RepID=A0A8J3NLP0_9ACTN|nr:hypothetical protein [Catellatospora bangladeshensis]GIF85242.1 hypothetical protein Cba03nite_65910 [Catellatospora bangladeshensis]